MAVLCLSCLLIGWKTYVAPQRVLCFSFTTCYSDFPFQYFCPFDTPASFLKLYPLLNVCIECLQFHSVFVLAFGRRCVLLCIQPLVRFQYLANKVWNGILFRVLGIFLALKPNTHTIYNVSLSLLPWLPIFRTIYSYDLFLMDSLTVDYNWSLGQLSSLVLDDKWKTNLKIIKHSYRVETRNQPRLKTEKYFISNSIE